MHQTYARLLMVACKAPRSIRSVLTGNERALRVSDLGVDEWLDVELGVNGEADVRLRIDSDGEITLPSGFVWINLIKSGQGSPTTAELLLNA